MNANSNSFVNTQKISKLKVHSPIKADYNQIDKIKSKQNKKVNKDINKTKINKNKMILSLSNLNSEKKSGMELESDFDINIKIYKRSNIKINNTENIFNKISIIYFIIIKYLLFVSIISCNNKRLFKLNDSIIKLELNVTEIKNDKIYHSEFYNKNKIKNIVINGDEKTINSDGRYDIQKLNINYIEIILSGYAESCYYMFLDCNSITKIDLSNFDTSQVTNMYGMFDGCSSLTSLNLSKFDTSKVTDMYRMFYGCSSLTSLNLSNFDTSQVTLMNSMFYGCSSLTSLNLSNFETSKVTDIYGMFYNCKNLEYINLQNFKDNSLASYSNIFDNVPINVVVCIDETIASKISGELVQICKTISCSEKWKSEQNKIDPKKNCIKNCITDALYINEYNGQCIDNCPNGHTVNNSTHKICKCELDKCLTCPKVALENNLCTECNIGYYPKENDFQNLGEYINCYNEAEEGYYLDNNIYKKCYYSCKTCELKGNETYHNCLICNSNYTFEININKYKNCYEYNYSIFESSEITSISSFNLFKNIALFKDLYLDDIDKGNDTFYIFNNTKIVFTSTSNQKNKENEKGIIYLNLGECEYLLKNNYNISYNDSLYILEIILNEQGMKIPKIEYEIYHSLKNINNLTKLNLEYCKDTKIEIYLPVIINDTLDKYNPKSDYYNDICTPSTSQFGTDITLDDRRNEFIDQNMSLCEENCELINYNSINEKVKCSCDVKMKGIKRRV